MSFLYIDLYELTLKIIIRLLFKYNNWNIVCIFASKRTLSSMDYCKEDIERLKASVEHFVGREIRRARDFKFLAGQIECCTRVQISQSTLKRLWGYVSCNSTTSSYVLDTLARMVGYANLQDFVKRGADCDSSCRIMRRKLMTSALSLGDKIELVWSPLRVLLADYKGGDWFVVEQAENCKLIAGDSFHCSYVIEDEPLYLTDVSHPGIESCDYVCGKLGGVKWRVIVGHTNETESEEA